VLKEDEETQEDVGVDGESGLYFEPQDSFESTQTLRRKKKKKKKKQFLQKTSDVNSGDHGGRQFSRSRREISISVEGRKILKHFLVCRLWSATFALLLCS
jgi:hypothetical protein